MSNPPGQAGPPSRRSRRERRLQNQQATPPLSSPAPSPPVPPTPPAVSAVAAAGSLPIPAPAAAMPSVPLPQVSPNPATEPDVIDVSSPAVAAAESAQPVTSPPNKPRAEKTTRPPRKRGLVVRLMSGVGETLVSTGLVLMLFVVWQLYFTTWEVASATNRAVESFSRSLVHSANEVTEDKRTDPPPEVPIPAHGQTFATLHVPRWDSMVIPIEEGTTADVLDTGYAGHYSRTQGPGQIGNFAIAGHRRSYGNSFRRVEELKIGDPLVVETAEAWLIYQVSGTQIVKPSDGQVIDPVPNHPGEKPTERIMTMTTCHPEYGNTERFIVYSKLAYWVPRGEGRPAALEGKV